MTLWSAFVPWCCALVIGFDGPVPIVIEPDRAASSHSRAPSAIPAGKSIADAFTPATQNRQSEIVSKLQIQKALRDAKTAIGQQKFAAAAALLEPMLERADGSELVLETLEAAYRGQLGTMVESRDSEQARLVAEKLRVLSTDNQNASPVAPSAGRESATPVGNRRVAPVPKVEPAFRSTPAAKSIPVAQSRPAYIARAKLDEKSELEAERSTPSQNADAREKCAALLEQAERHFADKQYRDALPKYEQAYEADPVGCQTKRDHWGYCLLWCAVERYNGYIQPAGQVISEDKWLAIEADCKLARQLAPSLEFTDTVMASVAKSRAAQSETAVPVSHRTVENEVANESSPQRAAAPTSFAASTAPQSTASNRSVVLRQGDAGNGWQLAETENFRIFHREPEKVERIARMAEVARVKSHDKWFAGEPLENWSPKCDLTIYPSASEYQSATGVGIQSPGHSKTMNDHGRVTVRQLFIRSDDPNMMDAVLPHEVAHVVFAGKFGSHVVPRWADEGMAVLTEPVDKQEAHLRNLGDLSRNGQRVPSGQLLTAENYPPGSQMRDFYAQSVGMCRFLVERGGEQKLVRMIRLALQSNNYDAALRQIYGSGGIGQLDADFDRFAANLTGWNNIASR